MSNAIKELRDYLAKSPSVVYPQDVLEYLPAIEAENAKLQQELAIRQESEQEKVIEYLRQENIDWEDMYRAVAAENANLREYLERKQHLQDFARLVEENSKLRKLVQDFDKCLTEAVRLAYIQGHMTIYDGTLLDSLHPRMRELRIEVVDG